MSLRLPICDFCKYLDESSDIYRCAAFPQGIPDEKVRLRDDGTECANGVHFESENPEKWENVSSKVSGSLLKKFAKARGIDE